ncbi:MAG: radical SAM protein [Myxococcota bacterium]
MLFSLQERSAQNVRYRVDLDDGTAVEAVVYRGDTLCISSQVGCAVGCPFCASGKDGFGRNLTLSELLGQVELGQGAHPELRRVTVSGVGEPLHNPHTLPFLAEVRERGLALSLTTSGGPLSRLRLWLHAPHRGLTISVHSGTDSVRKRAVPLGPSLDRLFSTLHDELPRLTHRRRKKTALAYLMVEGLNDDPRELDAFIERAQPLGLRVHLYDYNATGTGHRGVPRSRYEAAYRQLTGAGIYASMSSSARREANGGCGTLVASALVGPRLRSNSRSREGLRP